MGDVWHKTAIKELCDVTSSKRIYVADYQANGVPFYRGKEIIEKYKGNTDVSTELFIAMEKFLEIERKFGVPQTNDLLLTSVGTLGIPYVVRTGEKFYFKDGNLTWFKNFKNLDSRFLYYWLLSPQGKAELKKCTIGSSQPAFTIVLLKDLQIELPSLPIQHKISCILSAYDDLIENNLRRIRILEEMAKTVYDEWFVKFRFPGHEKVKMVESELGMLPEGWEVTVLEGTCNRITDGSHSSPKSVEEGLPMASVKDMHDWGFEIENCRKISIEDFNGLVRNDCKPLKGDVLIAKDGSYLKHVFAIEKELNLVILSSIAILRPNERVLPYYLAFYLRDPKVKDRLKGYVSGVALPRIILKDFRKFKCVLPPIEIQKAWVDIINPMVKNCWRMVDKNKNLRQTRDLLLPKLISGEIDVENLDIKTEE